MSTESTEAEAVADREVIITRVFDAPARLLFAAYTKPEHVMQWFGPKDWPLTKCDMDFRVGGAFHFQMTGPDGAFGPPFGGTYLEIVPDRKIVYDNGFELPHAGRMLVTVSFEERAGKTTMTISTVFDTIAMKDSYVGQGYVGGTNSGLDNLGDLVGRFAAQDGDESRPEV